MRSQWSMQCGDDENVSTRLPSKHSSSLAPPQLYRQVEGGASKQPSSLPPSSPLPSSPKALCSDFDTCNNDPFGFLATERKLKQERPRKVLQPKRIDQNTSWASQSSIPQTRKPAVMSFDRSDSDSGREAFATPKHRKNTSLPASDTGTSLIQNQRESIPQGRTKQAWKGDSSSPSPIPSTSQSKMGGTVTSEAVQVELQSENAAEITTTKNRRHCALTTDELLERLPHHPARRRVPGKKKARKNDQPKTKSKKIKRRRMGTTEGRKPATDLKGEVIDEREGESFVLDDEEREKYASERAERIKYFKNLDFYDMAKENVYII